MNRFELISKLGEGSYSIVFKVRRKADSKIYALKKVKLKNLSEKEKQNALNEVRILASLKSAFVISYKEAFIDEKDSGLCIVMEYADKGDLFQKISYFKRMRYYFEEIDIWKIFIQMTKGLKALHDLKILHRDLKSANIFLFNDGSAKIGDLNVSKVTKKGLGYTQTGTPYYASPEVWRDEPYDNKSDIWSLGCVTYEMINLYPPFRAESMEGLFEKVIKGKYPKINERYSSDLNELLNLLFQVEPDKRPTCDDILKNPLIIKRMEFLKSNSGNENDLINMDESTLLKTIRIPKNILFLSNKLPKANYESSTDPNISIVNNINKKINNTLSRNNTLILPSINIVNNRYSKLPNLKETRKNNYNIITDSILSKNNNINRNKSKESIIIPAKSKILSPLNKISINNIKSNNITRNQKLKKIYKPSLNKPKKVGLSKGLSELFRLYVSNDIVGNNNKKNNPNQYAIYLKNVYPKKIVSEKRSNSNSNLGSKEINGKKKLSPLNIKSS